MQNLIGQIQIKVNDKIYLKDPNSSDLGKKIINYGIEMIDDIGLEKFTFGKLAKELKTTESSIYRYFESKQKLLIYLTSWYWAWMEYQLVFSITNIECPKERLRISIDVLTKEIPENEKFDHINLEVLNRILIAESSKAYLTKEVDQINKEGAYLSYKRLVGRISDITLEINSSFKHSHTLISTIVEGIHHQKYFADHLPSLTDIKNNTQKLSDFYTQMALSTIQTSS